MEDCANAYLFFQTNMSLLEHLVLKVQTRLVESFTSCNDSSIKTQIIESFSSLYDSCIWDGSELS